MRAIKNKISSAKFNSWEWREIYIYVQMGFSSLRKTEAVFLISIAYQTIANRRLDSVRLCPDRSPKSKSLFGRPIAFRRSGQSRSTSNRLYQQQSNRRLRSEIGPESQTRNVESIPVLLEFGLLIFFDGLLDKSIRGLD